MDTDQIVDALALPPHAKVGQRVPKKHLLENGAPTPTDKRLISEGIEELVWVAALKPASVGVPAFRDAAREYLEIAVLTLALRPGANAARLQELTHRAIPYPIALVTADAGEVTLSLAHIRNAENEAGKTVLDGGVVGVTVTEDAAGAVFLASLALAGLPAGDLFILYQGWLDRLAALDAARLTGTFTLSPSREAADIRCHALREITRIEAQISSLRTQAGKEKQLSRQVDLNLDIKRLADERARLAALLG
jgi:hypothetical protein